MKKQAMLAKTFPLGKVELRHKLFVSRIVWHRRKVEWTRMAENATGKVLADSSILHFASSRGGEDALHSSPSKSCGAWCKGNLK